MQDIQTPGRTPMEGKPTSRPPEERISFIRIIRKIMKLLAITLLAIVIISGIGDDTCQKEADA